MMENRLRMRTVGTILAVTACIALSGPPARADAEGGEKIYQRILRSTVWVVIPVSKNRAMTGTGTLIDLKRKLILTNYHVVADKDEAVIIFPVLQKNGEVVAERKLYMKPELRKRGRVLARDAKVDLALIQLVDEVPPGAKALERAHDSPSPGQRLHSIGNPGASDALWAYTQGTVRQVYKKRFVAGGRNGEGSFEVDARIVETQSPVNAGDSGGPVVDDRGKLVAVTQGHLSDAQARLVSIFIDISEVNKFLASKGVKVPAVARTGADKPPPVETTGKPIEDNATKAERDAARKLKLANQLAEDGFTDNARKRYKEIIDTYPKTKAAEEARELLNKLKK
jgi:S1-C subfamily serine protease